VIVVGTHAGELLAPRATDGEIPWRPLLGGGSAVSATVSDGTVTI